MPGRRNDVSTFLNSLGRISEGLGEFESAVQDSTREERASVQQTRRTRAELGRGIAAGLTSGPAQLLASSIRQSIVSGAPVGTTLAGNIGAGFANLTGIGAAQFDANQLAGQRTAAITSQAARFGARIDPEIRQTLFDVLQEESQREVEERNRVAALTARGDLEATAAGPLGEAAERIAVAFDGFQKWVDQLPLIGSGGGG